MTEIGWQRAIERDRQINRGGKGDRKKEENDSRRETLGLKGGSAGHHEKNPSL